MSVGDVGNISHNIENVLLLGVVQHVTELLATAEDWTGVLMLCLVMLYMPRCTYVYTYIYIYMYIYIS